MTPGEALWGHPSADDPFPPTGAPSWFETEAELVKAGHLRWDPPEKSSLNA